MLRSPARMALPGEALDSIARYPAVGDARLDSDAERTVEMTGSSIRATLLGGELWSTRAHDWAELMEPAMRQLYAAILDRIAPLAGAALLDAGCGAGLFCRLAASRGATVSGVDAAAALLDIARERVPLGTFDLGDVGNLPYADATFDVVTGINSFQYLSSPLAALREVKRVAKPDAQIVIAALGSVDDCESAAYLYAIASMLPLTPSTPGPFALSQPGALEALAIQADLTPVEVADVAVEWCFADLDDALDALLSSGPAIRAIQIVGERRVRSVVTDSIRAFGTARGEYRLENTFRYLLARK
jgi:2-polyprenyl-3-methyl-5-hydroxy-6-metoxy-1,4-benzoquinol methylase